VGREEKNHQIRLEEAFGGFDVWSVGPPDHTNRPKDIDQLDRNMVFLEFNSFRNKGGMIFVINADDPAAKVLQRLKTTKQKIPFLQFQLGQYPNRRAQTSVKGFYILNLLRFDDVDLVEIWHGVYGGEGLEDITAVEIKFSDSSVKDFEEGELRIN
jgi:hypothetical protein